LSKRCLEVGLDQLDYDIVDKFLRIWWRDKMDTQKPPEGDWTNWLLLGGRGSGKTRAGAEWVRAAATGNQLLFGGKKVGRIALVGETYGDVREVMIEGPSGLLAVHPRADRPVWTPSRRRLEWSDGQVAQAFSSEDPDALRGPQFGGAWLDAKTIWGSLVAVLAAAGSAFGFQVDAQSQAQLAEAALQLATVAGSLFAVFGRLSATTVIE